MAVCLPTVVREFNRLMARLDLTDCRGLLPDNAEAVRCQRPLEMFFPFDPYLLRRSASFLDLRKSFVRWEQQLLFVFAMHKVALLGVVWRGGTGVYTLDYLHTQCTQCLGVAGGSRGTQMRQTRMRRQRVVMNQNPQEKNQV